MDANDGCFSILHRPSPNIGRVGFYNCPFGACSIWTSRPGGILKLFMATQADTATRREEKLINSHVIKDAAEKV